MTEVYIILIKDYLFYGSEINLINNRFRQFIYLKGKLKTLRMVTTNKLLFSHKIFIFNYKIKFSVCLYVYA